jgi:hypothetical protein
MTATAIGPLNPAVVADPADVVADPDPASVVTAPVLSVAASARGGLTSVNAVNADVATITAATIERTDEFTRTDMQTPM